MRSQNHLEKLTRNIRNGLSRSKQTPASICCRRIACSSLFDSFDFRTSFESALFDDDDDGAVALCIFERANIHDCCYGERRI